MKSILASAGNFFSDLLSIRGFSQHSKHRHIYTEIKNRYVRQSCKKKLDALCLTEEEVGNLFSVFELVDLDKKGLVTFHHVMTCIGRCDTKNRFVKRMLYTLDRGVRFDGFVIALWDFLTLPRSEFAALLFTTYSADASGYMDREEMQLLLAEVYGREFPDHNEALKNQLYPTDVAMVDVKIFESFARINQSVLFPLFKLQEALQDGIVGRKFWEVQAHKRYVTKEVDMKVFMQMYEEVKHGQKPFTKDELEAQKGELLEKVVGAEKKRDITDYGSKQKPKSLAEMLALPKLLPDDLAEGLKRDTEKRRKRLIDNMEKKRGNKDGDSSGRGHSGSAPNTARTATADALMLGLEAADSSNGLPYVERGKKPGAVPRLDPVTGKLEIITNGASLTARRRRPETARTRPSSPDMEEFATLTSPPQTSRSRPQTKSSSGQDNNISSLRIAAAFPSESAKLLGEPISGSQQELSPGRLSSDSAKMSGPGMVFRSLSPGSLFASPESPPKTARSTMSIASNFKLSLALGPLTSRRSSRYKTDSSAIVPVDDDGGSVNDVTELDAASTASATGMKSARRPYSSRSQSPVAFDSSRPPAAGFIEASASRLPPPSRPQTALETRQESLHKMTRKLERKLSRINSGRASEKSHRHRSTPSTSRRADHPDTTDTDNILMVDATAAAASSSHSQEGIAIISTSRSGIGISSRPPVDHGMLLSESAKNRSSLTNTGTGTDNHHLQHHRSRPKSAQQQGGGAARSSQGSRVTNSGTNTDNKHSKKTNTVTTTTTTNTAAASETIENTATAATTKLAATTAATAVSNSSSDEHNGGGVLDAGSHVHQERSRLKSKSGFRVKFD